MARRGRIEKQVDGHLYALNELLLSATTRELRAFEHRIKNLTGSNCGWILYRARPLLENLLVEARRDRRRIGIYKRGE
jgi:hypothetical protein